MILINEILACPREIVLVLDNYHVIRKSEVHGAIVSLLKHRPPQLRIIVLTHEDPPFPLNRMRAQRSLCELRSRDLEFTLEEAARFLREVMDLPVGDDTVAALEASTVGWIAGLQLAALSIPAAGSFAAARGEYTRAVLDYLSTEVLARQPPAIQMFLMRTSVLDRLCGPLCEAVLGDASPAGGSQALLKRLERANLFLVPLDAEQVWYRYHPLFAELLRRRLRGTEPDLMPVLHRRASRWYEARGLTEEVIQHTLAATDWNRAAHLIEQHGMEVFYLGRPQTILDWFDALPAKVARSRSFLGVIHAFALYGANQIEAADRRLEAVETRLRARAHPGKMRGINGNILLLHSLLAWTRDGDVAYSVALAVQAVDLLYASDPSGVFARVWGSLAFRTTGDVTSESERIVATAVAQATTARVPVALRVGLGQLGLMYVFQGRLTRAATVFGKTKTVLGSDVALAMPAYCFGWAEVLRQQNDLDGAEHLLTMGIEATSEGNVVLPTTATFGYRTLALVRQARGDDSGAIAAVDALVALARQRQFDPSAMMRGAATRAHLWLMQGNVVAAAHWADTSGLTQNDDVTFSREHEYLVLARVRIARASETALPLLDRLLQNAEKGARLGSAIVILTLGALARQALGDKNGALRDLKRALALGEPEGYIRVFVDEGAPMATLLRRASRLEIAPEYVAALLRAFGGRVHEDPGGSVGSSLELVAEVSGPLTARERDVLQLLGAGASNAEIANRLFTTIGTVKKHVHQIFGKLDVQSRAQLIARLRTPKTG